ncbi:MAG: DNA repair protein RecO [Bacteroidota bacterium]
MIQKTRGIVIHYIKYQETSIIVKIFTEEFGMVSFLVNGIRSSKSKRSIGYFQPFSLLDLVTYIKNGREIQRLSEYKYLHATPSISHDIRKATIALFLSEVLGKALQQEHGAQHELFQYLFDMTTVLDASSSGIENFHLQFLIRLTYHLGIGIADGESLLESMEVESSDESTLNFISRLVNSELNDKVPSSGNERMKALELIIQYFNHHGTSLGEIKSMKVLHQVFN